MSSATLQVGTLVLVFVASLPLSVMVGAALLGLRDVQDWRPNLVRLLACTTAFMILLLIFGEHYWPAMAAAAATVSCLHWITYWGLRWWVKRKPASGDNKV